MNPATRDDYFWLVSDEAAPLIEYCRSIIVDKSANVVALAKSLRKKTTPVRSALIMEQAQLRNRAEKKFPMAHSLFFTKKGYEQSTSAGIAEYKAARFSKFSRIADVCCGIGGDLMQLAKRNLGDDETIGVDSDPLACLFAKQNLATFGFHGHADVVESDFEKYDLSSFDAVHIDPDRRTHGRTVQPNFFSPSVNEILTRMMTGNVAVKVAPASQLPDGLPERFEREWIGTRRECKQQVIWLGELAQNPGTLTATCVDKDGSVEKVSIALGEVDQTIIVADEIGKYIYEPHPSILAARLTDTISNRRKLARIAPAVAYLTGDQSVSTTLLSRYKILKICSLSLRSVFKELKAMDVGEIEVKNRGAEKLLTDQFARLKLEGSKKRTVILTRHNRKGVALIARREK